MSLDINAKTLNEAGKELNIVLWSKNFDKMTSFGIGILQRHF